MESKKSEFTPHLSLKGDEKLLGAVCHFSIFFLPILLPLIVWLLERNKQDYSEFVMFQAKQSLIYQVAAFIVLIGVGIFILGLSFLLVGFLFFPAYFILLLMALIYAAFGGVQCLMGNRFQYYFIGDKIYEWRL